MDQNVKEIGNSSTPADSGDLPSDEVLPAPTDVPPLQVTDSGTGFNLTTSILELFIHLF